MFVRRFYRVRRGEWVAVALIAASIVGMSTLVIHGTDNTWTGLTLVSFYAGMLAVHGWRKLTRWRELSGEETGEPRSSQG